MALHNLALFIGVVACLALVIGLGVTFPQLRLFGPFVCRGPNTKKWVSITFDDGPDARSTPGLLDVLTERGVKAAFFCVGQRVEANPELAARIVREGHLLENHSYSHSNATNFFTVAQLKAELSSTQTIIQQATGVAPRWFRPPMGLSNPRVFAAARSLGLGMVGWSARGLDTKKTSQPEKVVARIARQLRPGSIILLHAGNIPTDRLITTVKTLLDTLQNLGYEVVRLDRMLS